MFIAFAGAVNEWTEYGLANNLRIRYSIRRSALCTISTAAQQFAVVTARKSGRQALVRFGWFLRNAGKIFDHRADSISWEGRRPANCRPVMKLATRGVRLLERRGKLLKMGEIEILIDGHPVCLGRLV